MIATAQQVILAIYTQLFWLLKRNIQGVLRHRVQ